MMNWLGRFNPYLLCGLMVLGWVACKTPEERAKDRRRSTLRVFMEVDPVGNLRNNPVPIYRKSPMMVHVGRASFLDEGHVLDAEVIDSRAGFAIRIRFTHRGSLLLENMTTSHKGRRLVIRSSWGEKGEESKTRWLAAPKAEDRIATGTLVFTPDATREEAEHIVQGLNNVAEELGHEEVRF